MAAADAAAVAPSLAGRRPSHGAIHEQSQLADELEPESCSDEKLIAEALKAAPLPEGSQPEASAAASDHGLQSISSLPSQALQDEAEGPAALALNCRPPDGLKHACSPGMKHHKEQPHTTIRHERSQKAAQSARRDGAGDHQFQAFALRRDHNDSFSNKDGGAAASTDRVHAADDAHDGGSPEEFAHSHWQNSGTWSF